MPSHNIVLYLKKAPNLAEPILHKLDMILYIQWNLRLTFSPFFWHKERYCKYIWTLSYLFYTLLLPLFVVSMHVYPFVLPDWVPVCLVCDLMICKVGEEFDVFMTPNALTEMNAHYQVSLNIIGEKSTQFNATLSIGKWIWKDLDSCMSLIFW